jgi:hypothetical protein
MHKTCDERTYESKEIEFVEWYLEFFKKDKELPCLRCSFATIIRCSNISPISTNIGCTLFQQYVLNAHAENSGKRGYELNE